MSQNRDTRSGVVVDPGPQTPCSITGKPQLSSEELTQQVGLYQEDLRKTKEAFDANHARIQQEMDCRKEQVSFAAKNIETLMEEIEELNDRIKQLLAEVESKEAEFFTLCTSGEIEIDLLRQEVGRLRDAAASERLAQHHIIQELQAYEFGQPNHTDSLMKEHTELALAVKEAKLDQYSSSCTPFGAGNPPQRSHQVMMAQQILPANPPVFQADQYTCLQSLQRNQYQYPYSNPVQEFQDSTSLKFNPTSFQHQTRKNPQTISSLSTESLNIHDDQDLTQQLHETCVEAMRQQLESKIAARGFAPLGLSEGQKFGSTNDQDQKPRTHQRDPTFSAQSWNRCQDLAITQQLQEVCVEALRQDLESQVAARGFAPLGVPQGQNFNSASDQEQATSTHQNSPIFSAQSWNRCHDLAITQQLQDVCVEALRQDLESQIAARGFAPLGVSQCQKVNPASVQDLIPRNPQTDPTLSAQKWNRCYDQAVTQQLQKVCVEALQQDLESQIAARGFAPLTLQQRCRLESSSPFTNQQQPGTCSDAWKNMEPPNRYFFP